jgi:hypothetical protein
MRISLMTRAGRACAAATLVFSLGLAPSLAHVAAPFAAAAARPALGPGIFPLVAAGGFNRFVFARFGFNRFGFNRFGPNRFDRFGFNRFNHLNRFDRFGFSHFGWNANGWGWNQLGVTGWGYWGDPISAPTAPSEPIIIGCGPPLVVNVVAGSGTGAAGGGYTGGCVIHKLIYDRDGKHVGERQTPEC